MCVCVCVCVCVWIKFQLIVCLTIFDMMHYDMQFDGDTLPQPSDVLLLLKYGNIIISKTGQEGGTAD